MISLNHLSRLLSLVLSLLLGVCFYTHLNASEQKEGLQNSDISSRFQKREKKRSQLLQSQYENNSYSSNTSQNSDNNTTFPLNISQKTPTQSSTDIVHNPTIFTNENRAPVRNGVTQETQFSIETSCKISTITTYHHNNGQGMAPGRISLRSQRGQIFGPWNAVSKNALGMSNKLYWSVSPRVTLSKGTYSIIDSDENSWSTNAQSRGQGMASVFGECNSSPKKR